MSSHSTNGFSHITQEDHVPPTARLNSKKEIFFLPGLLGYGAKQSAPFHSLAASTGHTLYPISYVENGWKAGAVALEVALLVRDSIVRGKEPILLGVSLGGLIAATAVEILAEAERAQLTVIAVDSPYGAETLKAVPGAMYGTFRKGIPSVLNGPIGNTVLKMMRQPPKEQFIEIPTGKNREAHIKSVITDAMEGLDGHSWSTWSGQMKWMSALEQPSLVALRGVKRFVYLECKPLDENDPGTPNNNVVVQPLAKERWQRVLSPQRSNIAYHTVHTDHCGFLEAQVTWERAMRIALVGA